VFRGLVLLAGLTGCAALAQSALDLPGIYIDSNAFPLSKANEAALTAALGVSGVDGLVLVLGWDGIEPGMGRYDWNHPPSASNIFLYNQAFGHTGRALCSKNRKKRSVS